MKLEFSPAAESDLEEIGDFIALDSPANAVQFIDDLRGQCGRLLKSPLGYVARPEIAEGLRSCAYGRYVLFFRVDEAVVRIERILHSAREVGRAWPRE
jgi:toxin ParE1/3/4